MVRLTELHVRKRKYDTGKWGYYFTMVDENGKRKQYGHYVYRTRLEALEEGKKAYEECKRKAELQIFNMKFYELVQLWMDSYCFHHLSDSTRISYAKKLERNVLPYLENMEVADIKTKHIDDIVNKMIESKRSKNSINNTISLISGIFTFAERTYDYNYNPAKNAIKITDSIAKRKKLAKHPNYNIEKRDIDKIFQRFTSDTPQHFLPLLLGYRCGLRCGEIFALVWDDVDFDKKTLKVQRQVKGQDKKGIPWKFDITKYDEEREIDLDENTIEILKKYRKEQLEKRKTEGFQKYYVNEDGYFTFDSTQKEYDFIIRNNKTAYATRNTSKYISQIIHYELNIPNFTMHSLRCTHATDLSISDVPLKENMERLGHKKLSETIGYIGKSEKSSSILKNTINQMYSDQKFI